MQPPQRYANTFNESFQKTGLAPPIIRVTVKKENQCVQPEELSGVCDRHSCRLHEVFLEIFEFQNTKPYITIMSVSTHLSFYMV